MALLIFLSLHATARTRVLVTTFDPFQGNAKNSTQEIARELQSQGDFEIVTCNLPVEYRNGVKKAFACIEDAKPDLVLSLGEGICRMKLETRGENVLGGGVMEMDNAGVDPKGERIVPDGPRFEPVSLPISRMYCALDEAERKNVESSASAGSYVCNEIIYALAHRLKGVPFGFVHVPTRELCRDADLPDAVAGKLTKMLSVATRDLPRKTCDGRRCLTDQIREVRRTVDGACEIEAEKSIREKQSQETRAGARGSF